MNSEQRETTAPPCGHHHLAQSLESTTSHPTPLLPAGGFRPYRNICEYSDHIRQWEVKEELKSLRTERLTGKTDLE